MKKSLLSILLCFTFIVVSSAQNQVQETEQPDKNQTNFPVKILYKPRAAYLTQKNGTICVTGTVTLRVIFLDSGKIGKIDVISGLPYGLSENAVEAAKKIKFKPAQKNGKAVSVSKTVTFNFSIY